MSKLGSYDQKLWGVNGEPNRRVVIWQDDWPPQDEVPHAGETVWDRNGNPLTVVTGIPFNDEDGDPNIVVRRPYGATFYDMVEFFSRTPPLKRYRLRVKGEGMPPVYTNVEATDEADAIAKAVTVEEVE